MSFTAYCPAAGTKAHWLPRGHAAVFRRGAISFHSADLAEVGIGEHVVLLIDTDTIRLGIRRPSDDDEPAAILSAKLNETGTRRTIHAGGAFKKLGVDQADARGWYELTVKAGLIVLNLPSRKRRRAGSP